MSAHMTQQQLSLGEKVQANEIQQQYLYQWLLEGQISERATISTSDASQTERDG